MKELEEIEETTHFDVSDLMSALEMVQTNPDIPKEKAEKIKKEVKEMVEGMRRSARIAEVKEKKSSAAATPLRNTSRIGVKKNTNRSRSLKGPVAGKTRNNKNRSHGVKAIKPKNNKTRNARNNVTKPNSEKLTGAAKGKSLFEQAKFIVENRAKIQSSTKPFEIEYYKKQYATLVDFIHTYSGNTHIELLKKAARILKSNPAVSNSMSDAMVNNNL